MGIFENIKKKKMGFYYDQQGFYYNQQQPGFYYNQEQPGFYYDGQDAAKKGNFAAAWKKNDLGKKVMNAAKKAASAKVASVMIANNHKPGATENRILSQISAERIAYEAAEIFMNATPADGKLTTDDIRKQLFAIAVKAIDGTK